MKACFVNIATRCSAVPLNWLYTNRYTHSHVTSAPLSLCSSLYCLHTWKLTPKNRLSVRYAHVASQNRHSLQPTLRLMRVLPALNVDSVTNCSQSLQQCSPILRNTCKTLTDVASAQKALNCLTISLYIFVVTSRLRAVVHVPKKQLWQTCLLNRWPQLQTKC